jgi:hypothetical protein
MSARRVLGIGATGLGLVAAYTVLFVVGSRTLGPGAVRTGAVAPAEQARALLALVAMATVDVAILAGIARISRLRGWRLWLLLGGFLYFVKTFTSMLEAAWFMGNVTRAMLPGLFAMTLPLCALLPPLLIAGVGRWRGDCGEAPPGLLPRRGRSALLLDVAVLAAIVYPALFFAAGYFIAWQSPEVRRFYGGSPELEGFLAHYRAVFAADPWLYPFEVLRGLLWVGAAAAVLWTSRGPAWRATLIVGLAFALVQNDAHFLPNGMMPATVRAYHFVETTSSNFLWALAIGWLLTRRRGAPRAETARGGPGGARSETGGTCSA